MKEHTVSHSERNTRLKTLQARSLLIYLLELNGLFAVTDSRLVIHFGSTLWGWMLSLTLHMHTWRDSFDNAYKELHALYTAYLDLHTMQHNKLHQAVTPVFVLLHWSVSSYPPLQTVRYDFPQSSTDWWSKIQCLMWFLGKLGLKKWKTGTFLFTRLHMWVTYKFI